MSTQMLAIEKELKARYQGRVILTVHDEVIATFPTPPCREPALQYDDRKNVHTSKPGVTPGAWYSMPKEATPKTTRNNTNETDVI